MRTNQGFEFLTLAVRIRHEEQHTRGVPRYNGRNLLENLLLFIRVTTEDHQIGHAGPRHRRTCLRRCRIIPEAGELGLDGGQINQSRGMGGKCRRV